MRYFDITMDVEDGNLASLRKCEGNLVSDYLLGILPYKKSIWLTNGQIEDLNVAVRTAILEKFGGGRPTTQDQGIIVLALLPVATWLIGLQHFQWPERET